VKYSVAAVRLCGLEPVFARHALALGAVAVPAGAVLNVSVLAVVAPFDAAPTQAYGRFRWPASSGADAG